MTGKQRLAVGWALLAAMLYAISTPVSKVLLKEIPATMMAAFLYLGAGIGMGIIGIIRRQSGQAKKQEPLTRAELPFVVGMVALDIAAPVLLMLGLTMTTAENASLLNNFEIVATSLIALLVFHEQIDRRLWLAIGLITLSSIILSIEGKGSFSFSTGSLFVLGACVCWGFENNCTRMLSVKDSLQVVVIKGFGSGTGSLLIALALGERVGQVWYVLGAMALGFVAYGLSIFFYVCAQRELGAARTSAYYAVAPFIGVALSWMLFQEQPGIWFMTALALMIVGTFLASVPQKSRAV